MPKLQISNAIAINRFMKYYGIFSNSVERYLLFDTECWLTLHTAKVLSSKFSIMVHEIDQEVFLENALSLQYTLSNSPQIKQDSQSPFLIKVPNLINYIDSKPNDIDYQTIFNHKKLCDYTHNVLYAAWRTDAFLNKTNNRYFLQISNFTNLSSNSDESTLDSGFLNLIDNILYYSLSIEEIKNKLTNLFISSVRNNSIKTYKELFYNELLSITNE